MIKTFILLCCITFCNTGLLAQLSQNEINKMAAMTPEQQEQYRKELLKKYSRQAKDLSKQSGIPINEELLPDAVLQPPLKQKELLAGIPARAFTLQELQTYITAIEKNIKNRIGEVPEHWFDSLARFRKPHQLHNTAAGLWYRNEPLKALLLQLQIVQQHPSELLAWNNCAAMLQLAGLPHKAIPVLVYCLSKMPGNNVVLNNLGQCYLKLGDISNAKKFLLQSITSAPFNPDANHSMGMICLYEKNQEAARRYLETALKTSQRASTIANYIRAGGKVNLAELRKMKNQWSGKKQKNYFDDLALEQFDIDFFPRSMADVKVFKQKVLHYNQSVDAEINYWSQRSMTGLSSAEQNYYRHVNGSIYSEIVEALLEELHKEFHAGFLALPFEASDRNTMQQAGQAIAYEIEQIDKTVTAPAGSSQQEEEAYRRIRCEKKKAVYDKYLPRYNGIIEKRYKLLKGRWKSYINQLVPILALDPTPGNRKLAYAAVAGYFSMLRGITGSTLLPDAPIDCNTDLTMEEANALLQSKRNLDIGCPEIIEVETEVLGVNIQLNCDGLKIDAGMETEPIGVGYEKNFKTGMSTLWLGLGVKGALEFSSHELGEGSLSNQFFISFDKHNRFADAGYRGNAAFEGKADNSIDFNYSFAMNAGFDAGMETSGVFEGVEAWLE